MTLLVGWLVGDAALALHSYRVRGRRRGVPARRVVDPRSASPRDLRRLPGIGESRAIEIARTRWRRPPDGPPLYLSDVPGIGILTEERVREWLDRRPGP